MDTHVVNHSRNGNSLKVTTSRLDVMNSWEFLSFRKRLKKATLSSSWAGFVSSTLTFQAACPFTVERSQSTHSLSFTLCVWCRWCKCVLVENASKCYQWPVTLAGGQHKKRSYLTTASKKELLWHTQHKDFFKPECAVAMLSHRLALHCLSASYRHFFRHWWTQWINTHFYQTSKCDYVCVGWFTTTPWIC